MSLSRIIAHVREQNWTAIAIDFLIVVSGVFIGLQVQEGSVNRARARQGVVDAAQLREVAQEELGSLCASAAYYATVRLSADRALALLAGAEGTDAELVVHAYRATEAIYFSRESGAFEGIVSAGRIGDVEDTELVRSLLTHFGQSALAGAYRDAHTSPYRVHVRRAMSHVAQEAVRARCSDDRSGTHVALASACTLEAAPEAIAEAASALRADKEVARLLAEHYSLLNLIVNNSQVRTRALADGLRVPDGRDACHGQVAEPVLVHVALAPTLP